MTTLFVSSFFIPDYHYDHYDKVQVLSHKVEQKRNKGCDSPDHDHYVLNCHTVKFSAVDRNGTRHTFEDEYDDDNYDDLIKDKTYSEFNGWRSILTWIGFIFFTFIICPSYLAEEDGDYTNSEKKDILPLRVTTWYYWQAFLGKDVKLLDQVADQEMEHIDRNNYFNSIPEYSDYTAKYNKLVEEYKNSAVEVEHE